MSESRSVGSWEQRRSVKEGEGEGFTKGQAKFCGMKSMSVTVIVLSISQAKLFDLYTSIYSLLYVIIPVKLLKE